VPVSPEVLLAEDSTQGGPSALLPAFPILLGHAVLKCHLLKSRMVKRGRLPAREMSACENLKAPAAQFSFVPFSPLLIQVGKWAG